MGLCSQADVKCTPEEYGEVATDAHGDFDRGRDAIALGIIRACVERGQPIFEICRGFQEAGCKWGQPCILKSVTYQGGITTACPLTHNGGKFAALWSPSVKMAPSITCSARQV